MTTKTNKISTVQLCLIMLGVFMSVRPIIENSLQAKFVGNDCIITCFIAGLVNLLFAFLICSILNKNPGKSFYEIIQNMFGKVFTKILIFLLAIVFLFKVILIDYQMNFLLYDAVYSEINWILFAIPAAITICYVAIKGVKVLARCYQVFIPLAVLIFLITLFVSTKNAEFDNILPLFSHSYGDFLQALKYILIQSCEYIFIFTFMENVKSREKKFYLKTGITFLIIFILIVAFYVFYVAVLGSLAPFVHESMITMTQFKDNSFGYFKIDIFTTTFWIPLVILQNAFCVYSISYCLNKAFNVNRNLLCILIVIFLYAQHYIPQLNNQVVTNFFYDKIGIFVLIFVFLLPIILMIASFKKPKKKEDDDENKTIS